MTVMTFKRREKELWKAKLKGGLCGTCRSLHDSDTTCNRQYLTWKRAIELTHLHKAQEQLIPSGIIWRKKSKVTDNEEEAEGGDERESENAG